MRIKIKKATSNNLSDVLKMNHRLFKLEYNIFDATLNMKWTYSEKGKQYFVDLIENGTLWIAIDDYRVVGYLAGRMKDNISTRIRSIAEIENIFVEESYRGQGVGKALFLAFRDYCADRKVEEIKTTTNVLNKFAREFYEGVGFDEYEITYKTSV